MAAEKPIPTAKIPNSRKDSIIPTFRRKEFLAEEAANRDPDETEFLSAIDTYKRINCRPFPTWSEVLQVVHSLGYRKPARVKESDRATAMLEELVRETLGHIDASAKHAAKANSAVLDSSAATKLAADSINTLAEKVRVVAAAFGVAGV